MLFRSQNGFNFTIDSLFRKMVLWGSPKPLHIFEAHFPTKKLENQDQKIFWSFVLYYVYVPSLQDYHLSQYPTIAQYLLSLLPLASLPLLYGNTFSKNVMSLDSKTVFTRISNTSDTQSTILGLILNLLVLGIAT